jgi:serine/threonine-protein kinase
MSKGDGARVGGALVVAGHDVGLLDADDPRLPLVTQLGEALVASASPWHVRCLADHGSDRDVASRRNVRRELDALLHRPAAARIVVIAAGLTRTIEGLAVVCTPVLDGFREDASVPLEWVGMRLRRAADVPTVLVVATPGGRHNAGACLDVLGTAASDHLIVVDTSEPVSTLRCMIDGLRGEAIDLATGTVTPRSLGDYLHRQLGMAAIQPSSSTRTLLAPRGPARVDPAERARRRSDDEVDALIGTVLPGRFRIVSELGRGSFGVVYRAHQELVDRAVAIKVLPARLGIDAMRRFALEIRSVGRLDHRNIVRVLHADVMSDGRMFVAMELLSGPTLDQLLVDGPLAPTRALGLVLQLIAGLAAAHAAGIIHGDVSPANMVVVDGSDPRLVLLDFGLSRLRAADAATAFGGTPVFMASEQLRGGRVEPSADLYAAAMVTLTLVAGTPPRTEADRARALDAFDPRIGAALARALAEDPADRFASAVEMGAALEDEAARPLAPRRRWWKAATAALSVAVTLALTFQPERQRPQEPPGPPVRLVVLPLAVSDGEAGPVPPNSAGAVTNAAIRLTGVRSNLTVIAPAEATEVHVDTAERGRLVLGATHVLDTRVRRAGHEIVVTASLIDLYSGRRIREFSGTYPSGDPQLLTTALVGMVSKALQLPTSEPGELVAGPAGAAYAEGMSLLRASGTNGAKAIPHFMKAIELNPGSALPYAGLAEAQLQLFDMERGQWLERAAASVRDAESRNAASVPVLLVSGLLALRLGRYEEAVRDFSRVTEREPTNSEAWRRLAKSYEPTNPDAVVATYEKAIKAQPDYYRHYLWLGNFYFAHGQYGRAENLARKVVAVAPGLAAGHTNLGLALMSQNRFHEAEFSLLSALRIRESANLLVNIGALYYAQERYEEALPYFQRCLAAEAPTVTRYIDLGDAYRHLGREGEAAIAYGKALELAEADVALNPKQAGSRAFLGLVAAQLRDRRRAEAELSQSLALEPENAIVIRRAAMGYEVLGQREKTLASLVHAPDGLLEELTHQPDMKDLQNDPRFLELLETRLLQRLKGPKPRE